MFHAGISTMSPGLTDTLHRAADECNRQQQAQFRCFKPGSTVGEILAQTDVLPEPGSVRVRRCAFRSKPVRLSSPY